MNIECMTVLWVAAVHLAFALGVRIGRGLEARHRENPELSPAIDVLRRYLERQSTDCGNGNADGQADGGCPNCLSGNDAIPAAEFNAAVRRICIFYNGEGNFMRKN